MPSKTQVGLLFLGSGFVGVTGFALWSYWDRRRKQSEARVAALMESKDVEEVAKGVVTREDRQVQELMKEGVVTELSSESSSSVVITSLEEKASSLGSPSGSGSNSPELEVSGVEEGDANEEANEEENEENEEAN